jgi:hypothetical protein
VDEAISQVSENAETVLMDGATQAAAPVAPAATQTATTPEATAQAAADAAKVTADATAAKTAADAQAAADAAKAKPVVPEKYEEFKMPEGTQRDPEIQAEFATTAKELGLTQEQAQRLSDLGVKLSLKNTSAMHDALAKARTEWSEASKTDKEIGGEKFAENAAQAKAVFDAFGTPELKTLLIDSGLGDHPEMLRWAHRVSKHISPDKIHTGRQSAAPTDAASVMYDAK